MCIKHSEELRGGTGLAGVRVVDRIQRIRVVFAAEDTGVAIYGASCDRAGRISTIVR